MRTLITSLGTNKYSDTIYSWPGVGEYETSHVAAALGRLWKADRIVVLATQAAEKENGADLKNSLSAADCPIPLFERLPEGRTEDELWAQFHVIRDAVEKSISGDVLLDITHGFRAQSFFTGAVINVLRAAGVNPDRIELVYGEFRKDDPPSPIWDLALFVELIDWAQALSLFLKTGFADPLVELGHLSQRKQSKKMLARGDDGAFPGFGRLVKAIERFADDLATMRLASLISGYEQNDARKDKARGSATDLLVTIEQCRTEVVAKLPPLALILDQLAEKIRPLSAECLYGKEGQKALYALARYYLELNRYPEVAATVREARINLHSTDERAVEINSPRYQQELRSTAENRFREQDPASREITDIRNDIEHCGFRKQPLTAQTLKARVKSLVDRFASSESSSQPEQETSSSSPPTRTYFVSRHPGAVRWAAAQGITVDRVVDHLELSEIRAGDIILGTLPVQLAAEVCEIGAKYFHLSLQLPPQQRGRELSADDMVRMGAYLKEYCVQKLE